MDIPCSTCSSARVWLKLGLTGRDGHHGVSSFSKKEEVRVPYNDPRSDWHYLDAQTVWFHIQTTERDVVVG